MSIISQDNASGTNRIAIVGAKDASKKVLEEDEYLDRMASIIKRDFFPESSNATDTQETPQTQHGCRSETPGTSRTNISTTSSTGSRKVACSMRLNEFLDKYTNEDNAYFEQLQEKDRREHQARFPWLYVNPVDHNKHIRKQLELPSPSTKQQKFLESGQNNVTKTIDWPYKLKNSLFYPPETKKEDPFPRSTVNYRSSRYMRKPIFKEPLPATFDNRPKVPTRFTDKIGVDGRLLNEAETPSINGYSFIPEPSTPVPVVDSPRVKSETSRFYIPNESPRDELAHRVYKDKVAKNIRTPRTGTTRTPKKS